MGDSFLQGLTPEQREAVLHEDGPLLILAGAGSGKTRVVTRRIAQLVAGGAPPCAILAITFTNKAAGEMRERVEQLLHLPKGEAPTVSTFHAFAVRLLRVHGHRIGLRRDFTILDTDEKLALVREAAVAARLDPSEHRPHVLAEAIGRAKEKLDDVAVAKEARTPLEKAAAATLPGYRRLQRERNGLDFEDLVTMAVRLLEEVEEVRRELLARIRYVLVDEYQDTNHAQYRLARLLAGERRNLAVCGDPDQSIYGWRGADMGNILRFEEDYPGSKVVKLERNYRSSATILRAANALIEHNSERKDKQLLPAGDEGKPIELKRCLDAQLEAEWVARRVEQALAEGTPPGEVAVVYRAAVHAEAYEEALLRRNVPCVTVGSQSFFERREVKDLLAFVRLAVNPKDDLAMLRALRAHARGVGKKTIEKLEGEQRRSGVALIEACGKAGTLAGLTPQARGTLTGFARMVREVSDDAAGSIEKLVLGARARSGIEEQLKKEEGGPDRLKSLDLLTQVAREADRRTRGRSGSASTAETGREFLDKLALMSQVDRTDDAKNKVVLTTVHAAKGLEFDVVVAVGLEEGLFPHWRSVESGTVEEERRLAYVAMTRARKRLVLTYSAHRSGRTAAEERRSPSRFLYELPPELLRDPDRGAQAELPLRDGEEPRPVAEAVAATAAPEPEPTDAIGRMRARLRAAAASPEAEAPTAARPEPAERRRPATPVAPAKRLPAAATSLPRKGGAGSPLWARPLERGAG